MRCCVTALIGIALCLVLGLWLVLPPVAGIVVVNAVRASGVACGSPDVQVAANPPFTILLGHADTVHLTCATGNFDHVQTGAVDITMNDVSLFDRRFGTLRGSLTDVVFTGSDGTTVTAPGVTLEGSATGAAAELTIPTTEAVRLAESRLRAASGIAATLTFKSPDVVTIAVAGRPGSGRLAVVDGSLVLQPSVPGLPAVTLVGPDELGSNGVFRLTGATVEPDGIHLSATVNVESLLGLSS